jgi:hypothetical protein
MVYAVFLPTPPGTGRFVAAMRSQNTIFSADGANPRCASASLRNNRGMSIWEIHFDFQAVVGQPHVGRQ